MTEVAKFTGVLQNDEEHHTAPARVTVGETQEIPLLEGKVANKQTLDQMLEAQMVSDIMRANANLKLFKTSRLQHDKTYREKNLEDARQREIREPLETALTKVDILSQKVARREELIQLLRKQLYLEVFRNRSDDGRKTTGLQEMQAIEENKTIILADQVDFLKMLVDAQQTELLNTKRAVGFQQAKIKEMYNILESQEMEYNEQERKMESEKEIYMGMVDSRENKIEKLLEEKDDLNERLEETESSLSDKTAALKKAQEKIKELQAALQETTSNYNSTKSTLEEIQLQFKTIQEENFVMTERTQDLQSRYDELVIDLDCMVEEGFYIPDKDALQRLEGRPPKKKRAVKVADAQKIGKKKKGKAGKMRRARNDDRRSMCSSVTELSIDDEGALDDESDAGDSRIDTNMNDGESDIGEDDELSVQESMQQSTQASTQQSSRLPMLGRQLISKENLGDVSITRQSMPRGTGQIDSPIPLLQAAQGAMGRFSIRKIQDEAIVTERLQASAAIRAQKDLTKKLTDMELELNRVNLERVEDAEKARVVQEGLNLGQRILNSEIVRLSNKIEEYDKNVIELKDEISVLKTANSLLSSNRHGHSVKSGSSGKSRRTSSWMDKISSSLVLAMNIPEDQSVRQYLMSAGIFPILRNQSSDDSIVPEVSAMPEREHTKQHKEEDGNYIQIDMLAYMRDWENVHHNSKTTQCDDHFEDHETQFDPEEFDKYISAIKAKDIDAIMAMNTLNANSRPPSQPTRPTSRLQSKLSSGRTSPIPLHTLDAPHKRVNELEMVAIRHEEFLQQLEELFQGMRMICKQYFPPNKWELLKIDFSLPQITSELTPEELQEGMQIEWQVKKVLILLSAINKLRNQFVRSYMPCKQQRQSAKNITTIKEIKDEQHDGKLTRALFECDENATKSAKKENNLGEDSRESDKLDDNGGEREGGEDEGEGEEDDNDLQVSLAIRCLDLLIQGVHHLLTPVFHLQDSEYPEIAKLFDPYEEQDYPEFNDSIPDSGEKLFQYQLRKLDRLGPTPETFPLTETRLTADFRRGAPPGLIPNINQKTAQLESPRLQTYMNRSSPRTLPYNVDQLLEMIAKRSRSPSPSASRRPAFISRGESPTRLGSMSPAIEKGQSPTTTTTTMTNAESLEISEQKQFIADNQVEEDHEFSFVSKSEHDLVTRYRNILAESSSAALGLVQPREAAAAAAASSPPPAPLAESKQRIPSPLKSLLPQNVRDSLKGSSSDLSKYIDYTRLSFDKSDVINDAYSTANKATSAAPPRASTVASVQKESDADLEIVGILGGGFNPDGSPRAKSAAVNFRGMLKSRGNKSRGSSRNGNNRSPLRFTKSELDAIESVVIDDEISATSKDKVDLQPAAVAERVGQQQAQQQTQQQALQAQHVPFPVDPSHRHATTAVITQQLADASINTRLEPIQRPIVLLRRDLVSRHVVLSSQDAPNTLSAAFPAPPPEAATPSAPSSAMGGSRPNPNRPQSNQGPAVKYYSPRVQRGLLVPPPVAADPHLQRSKGQFCDDMLIANILDDRNIFPAIPAEDKKMLNKSAFTEVKLAVKGISKRPNASRENVTSSSLHM